MNDRRNFLTGCIAAVVATAIIVAMICILAVPSIHNGHVEKLHRIDACQHADNVSDCLRINR